MYQSAHISDKCELTMSIFSFLFLHVYLDIEWVGDGTNSLIILLDAIRPSLRAGRTGRSPRAPPLRDLNCSKSVMDYAL